MLWPVAWHPHWHKYTYIYIQVYVFVPCHDPHTLTQIRLHVYILRIHSEVYTRKTQMRLHTYTHTLCITCPILQLVTLTDTNTHIYVSECMCVYHATAHIQSNKFTHCIHTTHTLWNVHARTQMCRHIYTHTIPFHDQQLANRERQSAAAACCRPCHSVKKMYVSVYLYTCIHLSIYDISVYRLLYRGYD